MMTTVYLAGPINGRTDDDCKGWREVAKRLLPGCRVLDPMRRDYRGCESANAAEIVEADKRDLDESDAVIVWFDRPSVGTSMEILYAWERGKRVAVVRASADPVSPWIAYHAEVVTTLEAAAALAMSAKFAERQICG